MTELTEAQKSDIRQDAAYRVQASGAVANIRANCTLNDPPYLTSNGSFAKNWHNWTVDDLRRLPRTVLRGLDTMAAIDDFEHLCLVMPNHYNGRADSFAHDIRAAARAAGIPRIEDRPVEASASLSFNDDAPALQKQNFAGDINVEQLAQTLGLKLPSMDLTSNALFLAARRVVAPQVVQS